MADVQGGGEAEVRPFTMKMGFNNGAEGWDFPVLPEKIQIRRQGENQDYSIIGKGKVHTIHKPDLAEISFESFFPARHEPYVNRSYANKRLPQPHTFVQDINRWMASGYPVRFVYVGANTENDKSKIFLAMSIASFEHWEEAGSPGDIYYSLKLKEYVFHAPQKVKAIRSADGAWKLLKVPPQRQDLRVPASSYTVRPGLPVLYELCTAARTLLGDSSRWKEIMALNHVTAAEALQEAPGRVLRMPDR